MIELSPVLFSSVFNGCNSNYFCGTKEELLHANPGIVIYGEECGQWRFITEWDLSSWAANIHTTTILEMEELRVRIVDLEIEMLNLKHNSIKIDEADFAYLLLRYKE